MLIPIWWATAFILSFIFFNLIPISSLKILENWSTFCKSNVLASSGAVTINYFSSCLYILSCVFIYCIILVENWAVKVAYSGSSRTEMCPSLARFVIGLEAFHCFSIKDFPWLMLSWLSEFLLLEYCDQSIPQHGPWSGSDLSEISPNNKWYCCPHPARDMLLVLESTFVTGCLLLYLSLGFW